MPDTVAAYPVSESRCPHCGHSVAATWWTPKRILDAIHAYAAEHGRPPRVKDWRKASPGTPSAETVGTMFGTFAAALRAGGYEPVPKVRRWTREEVRQALFEWRFRTGRTPRACDWESSTRDHPSYWQVVRLFGSWNRAVEASGYTPNRLTRRRAA